MSVAIALFTRDLWVRDNPRHRPPAQRWGAVRRSAVTEAAAGW
jgi:hypothetical protein